MYLNYDGILCLSAYVYFHIPVVVILISKNLKIMNYLPDSILSDALLLLPQVEVFRLRRVSWRFEHNLRPRLASLELDELEMVQQFRERRLEFVRGKLVGQIMESYGPMLLKLAVLTLDYELDKKFVSEITEKCPQLVELSLKRCYYPNLHRFSTSSLCQFPNLKVLNARLCFDPDPAFPEETIVNRILEMEKIYHIDLWDNGLLKPLRGRGVAVTAVKSVYLASWVAFDRDVFPSVEALKFLSVKPGFAYLPYSLKKLSISINSITAEDLEALKRLSCLTDFTLCGEINNFDFLGYFAKLEKLCIHNCPHFTADTFSLISAIAPLRSVSLWRCPAVCKRVFDVLSERKGLEHLSISGVITRYAESFSRLMQSNADSLRGVDLKYTMGIADSFLDQLCNKTILGLAFLGLKATRVTSAGILQLMERRSQLIQTGNVREPIVKKPRLMLENAAGLVLPRSLLHITVDSDIANELSVYSQLAWDAMVFLDGS